MKIGGGAPISVQSMTKTDTRDVWATVDQIWALEAAGCEIVRVAVPVREAAERLGEIKKQIRIPLIADIHFNYKLALIALERGVDGLRLNPGNIGARWCVEEVVRAASERKVPIRIGVNAGSLEKDLLRKFNGPSAEGMVESALRHIRILEDLGYREIKVSLKASDPLMMIEAYRMLADKVDYPFHLGVTEAGTPAAGTIKSAVGIGTLLAEGIGDTIRVSLSADPVEEVRVGIEILKSLGLRKQGLTFVACPSCGRADIELVGLAQEVEKRMLPYRDKDIHVAVMGCLPPGEQVVTREGAKAVEAVEVGEEVLTHEGSCRKVLRATAHSYKGDLIEIHPTGFPPFRVTPNHPVLAFPRPSRRKAGRDKRPHILSVLESGIAPTWVEAKELGAGWVLCYPVLNGEVDRATVEADGLGEIPVADDFMTLCGYYIAEGALSGKDGKPYQQFFYFNARQSAYVERLLSILTNLGIKPSLQRRRNTTEVISHSVALGTLLAGLFGRRAEAKRLPGWMLLLPRRKQRALLRALWEGDGYLGKVRGYWRATYSTSSWTLALQVHQLLLRLGIPAFLHHRDEQGRKRNWVLSVTSKPALARLGYVLERPVVEPDGFRTGQVVLGDGALYVSVRSSRRVPYVGQVHNLELDSTHSFLVPGAALHNCEVNGPGEARAADIGVAGGKGIGLIFRKGEVIRKVPEAQIVDALMEEVERLVTEREKEKAVARDD